MDRDVLAGLTVVDGLNLADRYRAALRPAETCVTASGLEYRLPRYFLEIDSWATAKETLLAPNFGLYELISTDVRETRTLQPFPRYVPLAVLHLAAHLSIFRAHVNTFVHIAANGGYRSPAHELAADASPHCWGTAANIYRIGDDYMDDEETVSRYAEMVRQILPGVWIRRYGAEVGATIDHLHVDLGRYTVAPRDVENSR